MTKLDQIVEEERMNAPGGEARTTISFMALDRIARRAFEHGVERTVLATASSFPHAVKVEDVKPEEVP